MTEELILLCLVSFFAGFIDSIVGGGGLIQTPAMFMLLPQYSVATLIGTTKIPSLSGTLFAAYKYSKKVKINWKLIIPLTVLSFLGAVSGAHTITLIDGEIIGISK